MAANLTRHREAAGLSYAKLVVRVATGTWHVETNVETIRRVCTGKGKTPETVEVELIAALAEALGVTVADISATVQRRLDRLASLAAGSDKMGCRVTPADQHQLAA